MAWKVPGSNPCDLIIGDGGLLFLTDNNISKDEKHFRNLFAFAKSWGGAG